MKPSRIAVMALAVAALLVLPVPGLASSKPTVYYARELAKRSTCDHTGISGPTGKVTLFVYAPRAKRPARFALSCKRAIAVGRAGRRYMFSRLRKSYGKTFSVQGTTYKVEEFIFLAASGPSPGFVGADTVVAAQYPTG